MTLETITGIVTNIAAIGTLIVASVGGWLALREYRLKVKAETRLAETSEIESDVKLLKLFAEIMDIAHARSGYIVSEKVMEKILSDDVIKQLNVKATNLSDLLTDATVRLPVGHAAQEAAISAVGVLGKKHPVLTPVAIQALEGIMKFRPDVAEKYLADLKQKQ